MPATVVIILFACLFLFASENAAAFLVGIAVMLSLGALFLLPGPLTSSSCP
jgi:hypothetical protein